MFSEITVQADEMLEPLDLKFKDLKQGQLFSLKYDAHNRNNFSMDERRGKNLIRMKTHSHGWMVIGNVDNPKYTLAPIYEVKNQGSVLSMGYQNLNVEIYSGKLSLFTI